MKTPTELFWIPQEGKGAHWSFDWKYHAVEKSEFDAGRAEQVIQETLASRSPKNCRFRSSKARAARRAVKSQIGHF